MSGRLVTERPLRIEGEFRGEIESASTVIVTEGGSVEAPIRARTVEIRGAVVGNVTATRELVIHATGKLHGDVETPSLIIERGAFFSGGTQMYRPQQALRGDVTCRSRCRASGGGVASGSEPTASEPLCWDPPARSPPMSDDQVDAGARSHQAGRRLRRNAAARDEASLRALSADRRHASDRVIRHRLHRPVPQP